MKRRSIIAAGLAVGGLGVLASSGAQAASYSEADAASALRLALQRGSESAVNLLGRPGGFLDNPQVRIPLPKSMASAAKIMRSLGQGKQIEELETALNRAAEAAVPEAKPLLLDAVRSMTVSDAKQILSGGDTAVTDYFAGKTRAPLSERFLPVVRATTDRMSLARRYNELAGQGAQFGLVKAEEADVARYVTTKAMDGLFLVIGEEERRMRRDPVGTGSALLKKVFGG